MVYDKELPMSDGMLIFLTLKKVCFSCLAFSYQYFVEF